VIFFFIFRIFAAKANYGGLQENSFLTIAYKRV